METPLWTSLFYNRLWHIHKLYLFMFTPLFIALLIRDFFHSKLLWIAYWVLYAAGLIAALCIPSIFKFLSAQFQSLRNYTIKLVFFATLLMAIPVGLDPNSTEHPITYNIGAAVMFVAMLLIIFAGIGTLFGAFLIKDDS